MKELVRLKHTPFSFVVFKFIKLNLQIWVKKER